MVNKLHQWFEKAVNNPFWVGIGAGLYPLFFIYTNNFPLLYSTSQLLFFLGTFIVMPIIIILLGNLLFKFKTLHKYQSLVIAFLNLFMFLFLLKISIAGGFHKKLSLLIFFIAIILAFVIKNKFKIVIIFQYLLALIGIVTFANTASNYIAINNNWTKAKSSIENVTFNKKPNIYFIQPDGYVNLSEITKGHYQITTPPIKNKLTQWGFTHYPNFRTNYASTLYSNAATFMMRHHYYNNGKIFNEALGARSVILGNNTLLNALHHNGYQTHYIAQSPYLLLDRPKLGFNTSNFNYSEVGFLNTGFKGEKDVVTSLENIINEPKNKPQFYFIEYFYPGHINGKKSESLGAYQERENYIQRLSKGNQKLEALCNLITTKDPEALIIIASDHGGFVGMNYTEEIYQKTQNKETITSIFSSFLAIKWPENMVTNQNDTLQYKSAVNLFRNIFSVLANNKSYLKDVEPDESYVILRDGAPPGVYKYISNNGEIICEKVK